VIPFYKAHRYNQPLREQLYGYGFAFFIIAAFFIALSLLKNKKDQ